MNKKELLARRDPEYFHVDENRLMVIACDSCGGIGLKESDILRAPNEIVASLTARVATLELLSLGVDIKSVSLTIINEPYPTADEIIVGVKSELKKYDVKYIISTEKNMKTSMTGLGITVMGLIDKEDLRLSTEDKYMISIAGIPSVGEDVLENKDLIFNQEMIEELLKNDDVLEVIPCGSSGIIGELSKLDGFDIDKYKKSELLSKSCGPASAALVLSKVDISSKYDFILSLDEANKY